MDIKKIAKWQLYISIIIFMIAIAGSLYTVLIVSLPEYLEVTQGVSKNWEWELEETNSSIPGWGAHMSSTILIIAYIEERFVFELIFNSLILIVLSIFMIIQSLIILNK